MTATSAPFSTLTVFLLGGSMLAHNANAADGPVDSSPTASPGLQEIVVTAQRQEENLQSSPVAVTAFSADQLESRGVQDIRDLQNLTPSLSMSTQTAGSGSAAATFYLRGLGQQRSGNGSEPAVALYVDDFYYPALAGNLLQALDVQQVEVLRGPQGTLFGRNTIGGAIRYETRKPDSEFGGYVEGTTGSFSRTNVSGAVNLPIGDELAVRLTAAHLKQDGFQDRLADSGRNGATQDDLGRVQLRFRPTSDLTVNASYEQYEDRLTGFPVYIPLVQVEPGTIAAFYNARHKPPYTQAYASPSFDTAYGGLPEDSFDVGRVRNLYGVVDYQVNGSLELKLLAGQSVVKDDFFNDIDASALPVASQFGNSDVDARSYELQALGAFDNRLHYIAGAFYYDERLTALAGQTLTPPVGPLSATTQITTDRTKHALSGYANVTFDFTDRLSVTGGYREGYEHTRANVLNLATDLAGAARQSWNLSLPLARIQYQWTPDLMSYLSASKGFRAGGFNTALNPGLSDNGIIPFAPETVWSYELGTRLQGFNGRVRVNPTVFYTKYKDIQVQSLPALATTSILENAGAAHIYGAELESVVQLLPRLTATTSASYLRAHYDSIAPGVTSVTLSAPFAMAPKWSSSIGMQYRLPLNSGAHVDFNTDYSYRTSQWSTAANDQLPIGAYGLLDARVRYNSMSGFWSVAVFGSNLTNRQYFVGGVDLRPVSGQIRYDVGRPREWGIEGKINL